MRFVIALMRHETNTFSPIATPLSAFNRGSTAGPLYGDDAVRACQGTNSAAAAFIDLVRRQGDEFVMPLMANAVPSGMVTAQAFESMAASIVEAVRAGCDAVMLAQFSTARARDSVAQAVSCPVLTSPDSAVLRLRELL